MNAERLLAHYEQIADAPDAIPRLRRFVLDLAVRGKLVPQDPNDEPASELLRRIAAEKARLVMAGEIRKPPVVSGLSEAEIPFAIPITWAWVRVGEIFDYDAGIKREPKELIQDHWLLELEDIEKDTSIVLARLRVRDRDSRSTKSEFAIGDILYGKLRPYLNKVVVADEPGYSTTEIVAIRPYLKLCAEYCALAFRRPDFVAYVERLGRGTKMPRLRTPDAIAAAFPLPPLAEQRRVVAKVDELMALCDRLEAARQAREATRDRLTAASLARLNAPDPETFHDDVRFALDALPALTARADQIKQLRKTILNLAVRGKLVPQDPNDETASELLKRIAKEKARLLSIGEISRDKVPSAIGQNDKPFSLPASWCWCRLRSLASVLGDGLHGTPNYVSGTEHHFVNGNNLEDGHIVIKPTTKTVSAEEMRKHRKPLNQHSVLVSINGTLGKVAFYGGQDIVLGKSVCYFNLTDFTDKRFAKLVLDSPYFADYATSKATGTTIKNLSLNAMNEFPFPLPPLAEQHRIVAKVDELMALCERVEVGLATADDSRRRLLEALLAETLAPAQENELEAAE